MSVLESNEPACKEHDLPPSVAFVVEGRPRPIGNLDVTRLLPEKRVRSVGPFVFLDHMGPVQLPPGHGLDVPPHPHIGLSTVTYLLEGELVHRDSLGSEQLIEPLALNVMQAGRGIVHSERSTPEARARGASMHGLQLWLALPREAEEGPPAFHHYPRDAFEEMEDRGARVRAVFGPGSPATDPSKPVFVDVVLPAGTTYVAPNDGLEHAVYVVEGRILVDKSILGPRTLLVRKPGTTLAVSAVERPARVVSLGGPKLDEHRFMHWNFVATSRELIDRAKNDWRAQRFPKIPGDDREFVPLPE